MRSRLVAGLRTRPGSFAVALSALLLIAAGFAVDSWMLNILGTVIWLLTLISLLVIAKVPLAMADFKLLTRSQAG
jgi:type IV secretory pathway TrbD component